MDQKNEKGPWFAVRYVISLHLFLLISIAVGMRVHLSVAIVAMTDNTTSPNPEIPIYNWTNKSIILSSFFWSYMFFQIPAGEICRKYGIKYVLIASMVFNTVAHMLIPPLADLLGSYGVIACRVVQGLAQGFFFPCSYALLGKWAPVEERSFMGSLVIGGISFGTVVTMPLIGFISATWVGWPPSFYIYGGVGFLWIISWFYFGADSPAEHKQVTVEERRYIENSLGPSSAGNDRVPWKSILTSGPVWAAIIGQVGMYFGYITLITEMPIFLHKVLKFDISSNGLLSALPYLSWFILGFVFGYISDYLMNNKYLSRSASRKLFTTIGFATPAISLSILSAIPNEYRVSSVTMLIISVGANAAVSGGFLVNHVDLSPKFAGILMGIGNTFGSVSAFLGPLVVHFLVTDETDKTLWGYIFFICAAFYVVANIFYIIFGSGELQNWSKQINTGDDTLKDMELKTEVCTISNGSTASTTQ